MMRVFSRIEVCNVESKGTGAASHLPSLGLPAWAGWFVCPSSVAVLLQRVEKRKKLRFEEKSPLRILAGNEGGDVFFDDGGRTILWPSGKRNGRICSMAQGAGGDQTESDLVLYALWEMGVFRNEEIGKVFGLSYSALSHIVRNAKEQIKKDPRVGSKADGANSQFKM